MMGNCYRLLIILVVMLMPATSYGLATRYQVTAPNAPTGSATVCQGGTVGSYSDQPGQTSCSVSGSANTNTITYRWVYDGSTYIAGASGTFVVGSATPPSVTLSAPQAAVLATLSPGTHTLACEFTPSQSNCSGTAGVAIVSPTKTITVVAAPSAISGSGSVCVGSTTPLASSPSGGTWSSSDIAHATVNSSGVVTGVGVGTALITYNSSGCYVTKLVSINSPIPISGPSDVCQYAEASYSHALAGGVWSSSDPSVASISGGALMALTPGSVIVSYNIPSSCLITTAVTVNEVPLAINGSGEICQDATSTLSNPTPGGTWSSGATDVAVVDASSGTVTGMANGTAMISYTLASGCSATTTFSVDPLPDVSVTPASATICVGEMSSLNATAAPMVFTLLQQNFNSGLGNWVVSGSAAPANMWQIVSPSAAADGTPGDGSDMLQTAALGTLTTTIVSSPSFSTVGFSSVNLSFDQYLLSVFPDVSARIEYSTDGGTTWVTMLEEGATIVGASSWGGAPNTTIALPAGALGQADVKLRWYYDASQYYWFLDNIKVNADLPTPTYSWTGAPGLSCTACTSPTAAPVAIGNNTYSVTVTSSTGCIGTASASVSVNPLPAGISGNLAVCVGTTFMLTNTTSGGSWSASNANVSIDATTGAITGASTGTSEITYALPSGCYVTDVATVSAAPAAIAGEDNLCEGASAGLTHVVGAGTWISSDPGVAAISPFGVISAITAGTTEITYTLPSGCITARVETINVTPAPIVGVVPLCVGSTSLLSSATGGGIWIAGDAATAGVSGGGLLSGVSAGFAPVTYQMPTGCQVTALATVNALPAPITGDNSICEGSSSTLSNSSAGGTWVSTNPTVASINASGTVTGFMSGFASVSYTLSGSGCSVSVPIIVNALPSAITGLLEVCKDGVTGLSSSPAGGTWTSSNSSKISVDPSSGVATGIAAGVASVTYTLPTTGCKVSALATVNPLPGDILGIATTCVGSSTGLFNFTAGGVWSSDNSLIADVSASGMVSGVSPGVTNINYTNAVTGCARSIVVTVNATPSAITGPSGVCVGELAGLGNADGGGIWSTSNGGIASVNPVTGVVTGSAAGTVLISYTLSTGCVRTTSLTVNNLPTAITGPASVCEQQMITFSNSTAGGTWVSDNPSIASVDVTGNVTGNLAGVTTISYTSPAGCSRVRSVTVNAKPAAISGTLSVCAGSETTITNTAGGGVWSTGSAAILALGALTGTATGIAAGETNVTYTLPTGCRTSGVFTVYPLPTAITGTLNVCQNSSTILSSGSAGGTWSAVGTNASADATSGLVTGLNAGAEVVVYTLPTGCARSVNITVNALPEPIAGTLNVCEGSTTSLSNATVDGAWTTSDAAVAYISAAGVVAGVSNGVAVISYTLPATGCSSVASIVVNPLPASITGADAVCQGESTALANLTSSGMWLVSSANASVDVTGMFTGILPGSATVSYMLPTGCYRTRNMIVNPVPALISAPSSMCKGAAYLLSNATAGGAWTVGDPSIAMVNTSTGVALATNVGTTTVAYTLSTGCTSSAVLTVSDVPDAIVGQASVCAGSTTTLTNTTAGGSWSTSNGLATIDAGGNLIGVAAGTTTVSYTGANGCRRVRQVTINALPALIAGPTAVCQGLTIVHSNANPGGTWSSSDETVATIGSLSGVVSAVSTGSASISYTLPNGCYRYTNISVNPTVEPIDADASLCVGSSSIVSTPSAGGAWSSSNTSRLTVDPLSGAVVGVGAGTVVLTYTLPTGCQATKGMTVNPQPSSLSGLVPLCVGNTLVLSSATTGGSWTGGDALIATVDATGMVSGIGAGAATVSYTLPTGCYRTAEVTVNPVPAVANVTGGGAYCIGGAGVNIGVDNSEVGTTYKLMLGGVPAGTMAGTGLAVDFGPRTAAGVYSVTGISAQGCSTIMSGDATIVASPVVTPSVSISVSADTVCAGTSVDYIAAGINGGATPSYVWSVAGTPVATGSTFSHVPLLGEIITVAFTSSHECPSIPSVNATAVVAVIPQLTPALTIVADGAGSICQGTAITFTASPVNAGTAPVYTWLVNGSIIPAASSSSYTFMPANGQSVVCRMVSSYRCPSINNVSSNAISVDVDSVYIPAVSIVADPGTIVSQGEIVTFNAQVSGAGPTPVYQWLISGVEVPGATTSKFVSGNLENGDSVTCVVTGSGACGKVSINSVIMSVVPSGITTAAFSASELKLMPNPTSGTFVVSGKLGGDLNEVARVEVTDMLGQVVYSGNATARNGELNERIQLDGSLANGMYMLSVGNASDRKVFHFVLKQ